MIRVKINQDFHWQDHSLFIFSVSTPFILKTVTLSFNCHFRAIAEMVSSLYIDWDNRNLTSTRASLDCSEHGSNHSQICIFSAIQSQSIFTVEVQCSCVALISTRFSRCICCIWYYDLLGRWERASCGIVYYLDYVITLLYRRGSHWYGIQPYLLFHGKC